jgi:hypothetical protein
MQERYEDAIEKVTDEESVNLGLLSPPHLRREHVFDCYGGMRLVISRWNVQSLEREAIHVAIVMIEGEFDTNHFLQIFASQGLGVLAGTIFDRGIRKYSEIAQQTELCIFGYEWQPYQGLPHWIVEERVWT